MNGLRDDDAESLWGNRASFASDLSLREPNGVNSVGVQVLVKEHGKMNNNPSFLSRKKSQGRSRPETKVSFIEHHSPCHRRPFTVAGVLQHVGTDRTTDRESIARHGRGFIQFCASRVWPSFPFFLSAIRE